MFRKVDKDTVIKGVFYDRNQDGDLELRSTEQIAMFIRRSKMYTKDRVFPWLGMEDLEQETFEELRKAVRSYNAQYPWLTMSNEEILRSGELIKIAPETGESGLTLAAILLFGKQHTIASVLPSYRTDLLCRINDMELYDDREIIRCNLIQGVSAHYGVYQKVHAGTTLHRRNATLQPARQNS